MQVYDASGTSSKSGKRPIKKKAKPSTARKRPFLLPTIAFIVLAIAIGIRVYPSILSPPITTIPDELIGVWNTTAPLYADRGFEFSTNTVLFHTGPGENEFTFHEIADVQRRDVDGERRYTITYADGLEFPFAYRAADDIIQFISQREVSWSREGAAPSTIAALPAVTVDSQTPPETGSDQAASQEPPPTDVDTAQAEEATVLLREVFSYRGAGRDPFRSLMETSDIRPFPQDLRVTSITFDPARPAMSVAVLRDTVANRAYPVRIGDELGRMRVTAIAPGEVLLTLVEFGAERTIRLSQGRKGTF